MYFMKFNFGAVDFLYRRFVSSNLHGIASQTTVVLSSVNTLICTVRSVSLERYGLEDKPQCGMILRRLRLASVIVVVMEMV
jgi:hypothetical protein